jgi:hypothetical protein
MIMLFVADATCDVFPDAGLGRYVAAAAVLGAPQGFLVSQLRGATAQSAGGGGGRFWGLVFGGIRRIALACLWAGMIAAGQLVYYHFLEKWGAKGYPTLPIAALRPGEVRPAGGAFIGLGAGGGAASANGTAATSSAYSTSTGGARQVVVSGFEEYKD